MPLGKNVEEDGLAAGARPAGTQPEIGGRVAAIGENWRSPLPAQGPKSRKFSAVGVDDRGAARRQEFAEEASLAVR